MTSPLARFSPVPLPQTEAQRSPALPSVPLPPATGQVGLLQMPTTFHPPFSQNDQPLFEASEPTTQRFTSSSAAGINSKVRSSMDGLFNLTYLSYAQRLTKLEGIFGNLNALLQEVEQSNLPEGMQTLWFQAINSAQAQVLSVGQAMLPGGLSTDELGALFAENGQGHQPASRLADQARGKFDEAAKTELSQQLAQLKGALSGGNTAYETSGLSHAKEALASVHGLLTTADTSAEVQGLLSQFLKLIDEQQSVNTLANRGVEFSSLAPKTELESLLFT